MEQEATQALLKLRERIVRANDIDKAFGGVREVDLAHLDYHVSRARTVADQWMATSATAGRFPEVAGRALARMLTPNTPFKKR